MTNLKLLGRIVINGKIIAKTGLHIGGSPGGLAIGNVDSPVIRNARSGQPYIPGSSLKGKMRSQAEKWTGAPQNKILNKGKDDGTGKVVIHAAASRAEYEKYWVNPLFGVTGDAPDYVTAPTRLVVRDVPLDPESEKDLAGLRTDMPYTEVKWEAAIDRVTSAATPRQIERVPAGAVFGPMEIVLSLYHASDKDLVQHLLTAMKLVEDDYLGGLGSRGSGQIAFEHLSIEIRHGEAYQSVSNPEFADLTLQELIGRESQLLNWVTKTLNLAA